uniref:Uncharacterized protein n=1 Tax=Setaria viridis TaxID=4556 RepID=A0A4U6WAW3_SETVI|nr:hypothetical protein SEVIR_1G145645v2 [Setaria viridis]
MGIGSTFLIGEPFLLTLLFDQLFCRRLAHKSRAKGKKASKKLAKGRIE